MIRIQIQHEVDKIKADNIPGIDNHVTGEMLSMFVSHLHKNSFLEIQKQELTSKRSVVYSVIGYGMDKREYFQLKGIYERLKEINHPDLIDIIDSLNAILTTMTPSSQ